MTEGGQSLIREIAEPEWRRAFDLFRRDSTPPQDLARALFCAAPAKLDRTTIARRVIQ